MQYINHWPDTSELAALPEIVAQDLYTHLTEPFDNNKSSAKAFWEETSTTLIILEPNDSIKQLEGDDQIQFTLSNPEDIISMKMGYQLLLAIVNDSGAGNYLLVPPELSHIITE